jgi:hypothetical protein
MDCYQGNESQKKLMLRIYAIQEFLFSHPIGKSMGLDINSSLNSLTKKMGTSPVLKDGFSWSSMYCLRTSIGAPPTELAK